MYYLFSDHEYRHSLRALFLVESINEIEAKKVAMGGGASFEPCMECRNALWDITHLDFAWAEDALVEAYNMCPGASHVTVIEYMDDKYTAFLSKYNKRLVKKFLREFLDIEPTDKQIITIVSATTGMQGGAK
jgi:hypothetical protein